VKRFLVFLTFLVTLFLMSACGGNSVGETITEGTGLESMAEPDIEPTPVVEVCLPAGEHTDDLYEWDLGVDLFLDRVKMRKSDLPNLHLDGQSTRSRSYSREKLAREDSYPLEKLNALRNQGLMLEWRMTVPVNYEQVRRLSNDFGWAVHQTFAELAAPDSPVYPNLQIKTQIFFFNSAACAQKYFASQLMFDLVETKTLEGFVSESGHYEVGREEGGITQSALAVPNDSFPAVIVVTSQYEAPDYLDQAMVALETAGEEGLVTYFESLAQSGASFIDTGELLERLANRYWRQVSVAP
jgi:hypothetical protein